MKKSLVIGAAAAAFAMVAIASGASAQSWTDSTSISGRIYTDFTNLTTKTDGTQSGTANGTGFDVTRFYIGVDHKFNDVWAMNLTTDMGYSSGTSNVEVFVKKAYLQGTFSPALVVRVGSADMPWIPYVEDLYGYRYFEKTMIDRKSYGNSADWGLHALGKLNTNFSYAVSVVNGGGYKVPTRSKGLDVEGRVSAKFGQWNFGLGGYTGKLGKETYGTQTYHDAERLDGIVAFTGDRLRVGVEGFSANDYTQVLSAASDKANGTSVFASYRVTPIYTVFGRAEQVNPSETIATDKKDEYYNLGISYAAFKGVDFSLALKHDENNTGGGHKTVSDEIGIWSQLRY
jgi:hypothetical protein